jgi:hypothetical protein
MATYYNYLSVRDQIIIAKQNGIISNYNLEAPKNIIGIHVNKKTWEAKCSDPCMAGCCEILLHIIFGNHQIPLQVQIYYVKKASVAYVTFIPSVLDILKKRKILNALEIVSDNLLPRTAPFKGKI